MTKYILILLTLTLSSCTTWQERADANRTAYYDRLANEANNGTAEQKGYKLEDRNMVEYFTCLMRHSGRFNQTDSRYICN